MRLFCWSSACKDALALKWVSFFFIFGALTTGCRESAVTKFVRQTASIAPTITSLSLSKNVLYIQGTGLNETKKVSLSGGSVNADLKVLSISDTLLTVAANTTLSLKLGTVYSLFVENSVAAVTAQFNYDFTSFLPGEFSVGSTELVVVPGKVGIGTATPNAPLHVSSPSQSSSVQVAQFTSSPTATGTSYTTLRLEKGTNYGGDIAGYLNQTVDSGLAFFTVNANTAVERMRLSSLGRVSITGNLGVGTSSPSSNVEVTGSTNPGVKVSTSGTNYSGHLGVATATAGYSNLAGIGDTVLRSDSANLILSSRTTNTGTPAGDIVFSTNSTASSSTDTEKMRISNAGFVTIGTSASANGSLEVKAASIPAISVKDSNSYQVQLAIASNPGNYSNLAGAGDGVLRSTTGNLVFATENNRAIPGGSIFFGTASSANSAADTIKLSILNNGDIGIGTTTPVAGLDVSGNTGTAMYKGMIRVGGNAAPAFAAQGSYISWNGALGGGAGETDFINHRAAVAVGNSIFNFYDTTSSNTTSTSPGDLGNVVGTTTATGVKLVASISSSGVMTLPAGTVSTSDLRLKKDLHSIENPLDKLLTLQGYTYFWKDKGRGEARQMGVIAQEVQKVFPEVVQEQSGGYLAVGYDHLVAGVIAAIKEFYSRFTASQLKTHEQIEQLKAENKELKTALCRHFPEDQVCKK